MKNGWKFIVLNIKEFHELTACWLDGSRRLLQQGTNQTYLIHDSGQGNLRLWASNYKLSFVKQLLSACVFLISLDLPTFLEKVLMKIEKILHTCLLHCALRCYTKSRLKPCRVEWPNLANSLLSLGNIGIAQIKSYHWKFLFALIAGVFFMNVYELRIINYTRTA